MRQTTQKIIWVFLALLAVGSLGWGIYQAHLSQQTASRLSQVKNDYRKLQVKQAKLNGSVIQAHEDQAVAEKAVKKVQNNSADNAEMQTKYQTMVNNVTMVFKGLYNYDQDSYSKRSDKVRKLISAELNKQYFGSESQRYGDGSQVVSELKQIHVYREAVSGSQLTVLVVAKYQSRYTHTKTWNQGTSVYEVKYDSSKQVVTGINSVLSQNK